MVKQTYDVISPVSLNGHRLSPIIFLHGLCDTRRTWKKAVPAIVRNTGRKAYVLDARNHGESSWAVKLDFNSLTEDVLNFMHEQNIPKAILVGNSMGGRTAINFALKYPARVDMLIVEDMTPKNLYTGKGTFLLTMVEAMNYFLKQIPSDIDLVSAKQMYKDVLLSKIPEKLITKEKFYENYDLDMIPVKKVGSIFVLEADMERAFKMLNSDSFNQNLPKSNLKFDGDTLFVYGTKGFFKLDKDPTVKKLFPRAVLKQIEGASHTAHIDYPEEFVKIVSDFILHKTVPGSKY